MQEGGCRGARRVLVVAAVAAAGGRRRLSGCSALPRPQSRLIGRGSSAPRRLACLATARAGQSEIPAGAGSANGKRVCGEGGGERALGFCVPSLSFFPSQSARAKRHGGQPIAGLARLWLIYLATPARRPMGKIGKWRGRGRPASGQ